MGQISATVRSMVRPELNLVPTSKCDAIYSSKLIIGSVSERGGIALRQAISICKISVCA